MTSSFLYKNLGFDPRRDFTPIIAVADMPILFAASAKQPFSTFQEFLEYARKNPGKLSYGSSGNGSIGHLSAELFKHLANVDPRARPLPRQRAPRCRISSAARST